MKAYVIAESSISASQSIDGPLQLFVDMAGCFFKSGIPHNGQHLLRINCGYDRSSLVLVHNYITGKQQAEIRFRLQALVCNRRIACS